ncbi:unnamed protein product, partial [Choristocarpus tenellus]
MDPVEGGQGDEFLVEDQHVVEPIDGFEGAHSPGRGESFGSTKIKLGLEKIDLGNAPPPPGPYTPMTADPSSPMVDVLNFSLGSGWRSGSRLGLEHRIEYRAEEQAMRQVDGEMERLPLAQGARIGMGMGCTEPRVIPQPTAQVPARHHGAGAVAAMGGRGERLSPV